MLKNPEVDTWFSEYDNPQKKLIMRLRELILSSDDRISECIKWKSPTFTYKGNIASFNPRSKKHASLMFHTGATIPGDYPHLEGGEKVARYMKFTAPEDVDQLETELISIFKAWCDTRDAI